MAEVLHGNASGNQLNATTNKSQVYGLAGNDTLTSDGKSDVLLVGGSGDDSLIMYGGKGSISGGAGNDTFDLTYSADRKLSAVIEDLEPANDKIIVNFDGSAAPQLTSSVSGNDVILRDGDGFLNVTLKGVRENDYFDGTASNETWEVLEITNNEREAKNLPWLTMSADLMQGASVRAQEITALGLSGILTDHTRPNGEDFSTVLEKEYVSPPHENLEAGAASAAEVMENWMDSKTHRENILNSNFNKLGVGYNYQDDGDPTHHRYYWTQLFADNLKSPEIVSTADLLTANIEVNTVKKFVTLTENPDTYSNTDYSATIAALGGADRDSLLSTGDFVTLNGNGDDYLINQNGLNVKMYGGDGDDTIGNFADSALNISISGGAGNDSISNSGNNHSLVGEEGNYSVSIGNHNFATIDGGDANDSIRNGYGDSVSVAGGAGNDTIRNDGHNVTINGGADNEEIIL